jgi:hypothetical protein
MRYPRRAVLAPLIVLLLGVSLPASAAAPRLTVRAARSALARELNRFYGVRLTSSTWHRKSRTRLTATWRGRRAERPYHGRATATLAHHRVNITLAGVRAG